MCSAAVDSKSPRPRPSLARAAIGYMICPSVTAQQPRHHMIITGEGLVTTRRTEGVRGQQHAQQGFGREPLRNAEPETERNGRRERLVLYTSSSRTPGVQPAAQQPGPPVRAKACPRSAPSPRRQSTAAEGARAPPPTRTPLPTAPVCLQMLFVTSSSGLSVLQLNSSLGVDLLGTYEAMSDFGSPTSVSYSETHDELAISVASEDPLTKGRVYIVSSVDSWVA